ncbi:branched-chain amino acid aminotransferase [Parahaliea maris]|uniref:Branched-chain-amino-acid aminotransferase n=1 Tax=Parahaliea maris TaxID=2716870 RepID=A0A5C8ZP03_9GAMM|nr:branched-chain amino acid aminotransferase [Parahaliea maris]TXS90218.1 branched-chain amino acid aminotransferase [Parahaliea maris]
MTIQINALPEAERGRCPETYSFGTGFADHMFTQVYDEGRGWHDAQICPFGNFSLHPAAAVLHYSQEIFEGLKAYRRKDGGINLFRPEANAARFNRSAQRMVMPEVDAGFHVEALKQLVALDQAWVPGDAGASLYIRPAMIATTPKLGLGAAASYLHFVITGPAGPYYPQGFNPVSVYVSDEMRRAVKGGVGEAKTGGNYAASLYVSEEVARKGYTQVLWLDAIEGRYVEEVGAMNICFVYDGSLIRTPALSGSILPGITRDSLLKLAPTLGYEVEEARLDINEVMADIASGRITEVFGCGTAAVVSPVGLMAMKGRDYEINGGQTGPVARRLFDELMAIQYGDAEDPFGWVTAVD